MQYVRSESVVSRVIAGETLIIPVRKGVADLASIYSLNQVATVIWQAIQQPRRREEIVAAIAQEFVIEPHQVERDVEIFLDDMHAAGLIAPVESHPIGVPA
jgi:hypothetical protein